MREFTEQDLAEIYELRTALETQAFRTLALGRTVPEAAREAMRRYSTLNSRSARRLIVDADLAFHRAIVVAAGNARLARAFENLQAEIELCLAQLAKSYASVRELATQHAELLESIESGRPATAEAAIRAHLENATAWLIEHVAAATSPP